MSTTVPVEDELAGDGAPAILATAMPRLLLDIGGEPHGLGHQIA
jgi:hypothetical protein